MKTLGSTAILVLWLFVLSAVDLPLLLRWDSQNRINHYPDRNAKSYDWNEDYRIRLDLDSLKVKSAELCVGLLALKEEEVPRVYLDHFSFRYTSGKLSYVALSQQIGLGEGYYFESALPNYGSYDSYLYDAHRFNGIGIGYSGASTEALVMAGGNATNQALALASIKSQMEVASQCLDTKAVTEFMARDAYWNSPRISTALNIDYTLAFWQQKADAGIYIYPDYEGVEAHQAFFAAGESNIRISPKAKLLCHYQWEQKEYYPQKHLTGIIGLELKHNAWKLLPGYRFDRLKDDRIDTYFSKLSYSFEDFAELGLLYEYVNGLENSHGLVLHSKIAYRF